MRLGPTGRKRRWHRGDNGEPDCLTAYTIARSSGELRRQLLARDGGACQCCGFQCVVLRDADRRGLAGHYVGVVRADAPFSYLRRVTARAWIGEHVIPLYSVDRSKPFDHVIWYWSLENCETRCINCAAAKNAREAKARAKAKRQRRKFGPKGREQKPLLGLDGRRLV